MTVRVACPEQKHWLLHVLYARWCFDSCMVLIQDEKAIPTEYTAYINGLIERLYGRLNSSLLCFQKSLSFNPSSVPSLKQLGRTLYCLGKHEKAKAVYLEILRRQPNDWVISCQLGICFTKLNKLDQAKECFLKCIEIDGKRGKGYIQLARHYVSTNKAENALKLLKQATSIIGDNPNLLVEVGLLYLQLQKFDEAFVCFGNALTYDPNNPKAILAAGSIIQRYGDYDVALTKYRTVAAVASESPALWNNVGMAFFSKNKFVASISCLKRASYLQPFDWKILINLGLVHMYSKQYASAFCFLSAGIRMNPRCSQSYMLMAITLTHLLDHENAERAYKVALQLDECNPLLLLNYATFCHKNGRKDECKTFLQKASSLEMDQTVEEALEIRTGIQSLAELNNFDALRRVDAKIQESVVESSDCLPDVPTDPAESCNGEAVEVNFVATINSHVPTTSQKLGNLQTLRASTAPLAFFSDVVPL